MKTRNLIVISLLIILLSACQKQEVALFEQLPGVHFTIAEYSYSFKEKLNVEKDTIKLPLEIYGEIASTDRKVSVVLVEEDTAHVTTIQPERYKVLEGVVPAESSSGTVSIELNYGKELEDSVYVFYLKIEPNNEFQEVGFKKKTVKINVTAKEIQPANWTGCLASFFGAYSTRWWEFIKETTQRTSLPYWEYRNPDPVTWWMTQAEFYANVAVVKTALRKYNEGPDGPLMHDDGPNKGKPVEMP